jgi:hypothetical protein
MTQTYGIQFVWGNVSPIKQYDIQTWADNNMNTTVWFSATDIASVFIDGQRFGVVDSPDGHYYLYPIPEQRNNKKGIKI